MLHINWKASILALASLGLVAPALGDQMADMQSQIDALRSELNQLRADEQDSWLNERRAEEVKGLIHEVLSDADTRASLLNDGAVAGHDGDHFFLASPDGAYSLYIAGETQFRYVYNNQDNSSGDEDEGGFQTRRLEVEMWGQAADPKINYLLKLIHSRSTGNTSMEEWELGYDLTDNLTIKGGVMKQPFLREEVISSSKQLAVERTCTNAFFTIGYAEGIRLIYGKDNWNVNLMLGEGANSGFSEFDENTAELALTMRGDIALAGELQQGKDFTGWDGESQSVILGGAYYFELGDGNNSAIDADRAGSDYHSWTVDLSYENQGINLYGAYIGANIDPDETTAAQRDMTGLVIQGGVDVVPDKLELFARWEYIDGDVAGEDEFDAWTTGFNYYINGHRVKFSADVVYLNKNLPTANPFGENPASRGLGLISGTEDEMAVRTQMQLLF